MWPFGWIKKQFQKQETVEDVYEQRGIGVPGVGQTVAGLQGIPLPPQRSERRKMMRHPYLNPTPPPSESNGDGGLLTGILIGEMLSSNSPTESLPTESTPATEFQGFGGGESGGGGASGSYDAPSDSSSSSDSSSFDTSSSDSGSSGGSDF